MQPLRTSSGRAVKRRVSTQELDDLYVVSKSLLIGITALYPIPLVSLDCKLASSVFGYLLQYFL